MNDKIDCFLASTVWSSATIESFPADWSTRQYARLHKNKKTAILLQSSKSNASNARIQEWSLYNKHYKNIGINVPDIIHEDLDNGYILMSDFGNETIANKGIEAYLSATQILVSMRDHSNSIDIPLQRYEDTAVYQKLSFFPQYILNKHSAEQDYMTVWKEIEKSLPPCPRALTQLDFAAMNLMWNNGIIGVIDFQDSCDGPFVYDLVNLLEDIRLNIPQDIKKACKNKYCEDLSDQDRQAFEDWYPVMTAQFHSKVLGQIQFLRTHQGRDDLMIYYDPLLQRLRGEIHHPTLSPLKEFIGF